STPGFSVGAGGVSTASGFAAALCSGRGAPAWATATSGTADAGAAQPTKPNAANQRDVIARCCWRPIALSSRAPHRDDAADEQERRAHACRATNDAHPSRNKADPYRQHATPRPFDPDVLCELVPVATAESSHDRARGDDREWGEQRSPDANDG